MVKWGSHKANETLDWITGKISWNEKVIDSEVLLFCDKFDWATLGSGNTRLSANGKPLATNNSSQTQEIP